MDLKGHKTFRGHIIYQVGYLPSSYPGTDRTSDSLDPVCVPCTVSKCPSPRLVHSNRINPPSSGLVENTTAPFAFRCIYFRLIAEYFPFPIGIAPELNPRI